MSLNIPDQSFCFIVYVEGYSPCPRFLMLTSCHAMKCHMNSRGSSVLLQVAFLLSRFDMAQWQVVLYCSDQTFVSFVKVNFKY